MSKVRQTVRQDVPESRYLEVLNTYGLLDPEWQLLSSEPISSPELGPPGAHEPHIRIMMSRLVDAPEKRPPGSSMKEILGMRDV